MTKHGRWSRNINKYDVFPKESPFQLRIAYVKAKDPQSVTSFYRNSIFAFVLGKATLMALVDLLSSAKSGSGVS